MASPARDNQIRAAMDRATEEMIFIGPDHPYYFLLADLVTAVGKAWQQGYKQGQHGGLHPNPYAWSQPSD